MAIEGILGATVEPQLTRDDGGLIQELIRMHSHITLLFSTATLPVPLCPPLVWHPAFSSAMEKLPWNDSWMLVVGHAG